MLMRNLEDDQPVVYHVMTETQPPDLVQLTTIILEEPLSRSNLLAFPQSSHQATFLRACCHWPVLVIPTTIYVWFYSEPEK